MEEIDLENYENYLNYVIEQENNIKLNIETYETLIKAHDRIKLVYNKINLNKSVSKSKLNIAIENYEYVNKEFLYSNLKPLTFNINKEELIVNFKSSLNRISSAIQEVLERIKDHIKKSVTIMMPVLLNVAMSVSKFDGKLKKFKNDISSLIPDESITLDSKPVLFFKEYFPLFIINNKLNMENILVNIHIFIATLSDYMGGIDDKVYNIINHGISHDPRNDALDFIIKLILKNKSINKVVDITYVYKDKVKYLGYKDNEIIYDVSILNNEKNITAFVNTSKECKISRTTIFKLIDMLRCMVLPSIRNIKSHLIKFQNDIISQIENIGNKDNTAESGKIELIKKLKNISISYYYDIFISIFLNTKAVINFIDLLLEDFKVKTTRSHYDIVIDSLINQGYDAEINYLNNDKQFPYIYSNDLFEKVSKSKNQLVAFAISDNGSCDILSEFVKLPTNIKGVIFLDSEQILGNKIRCELLDHVLKRAEGFKISNKKLLQIVYYHELGHIVLQQGEGEAQSNRCQNLNTEVTKRWDDVLEEYVFKGDTRKKDAYRIIQEIYQKYNGNLQSIFKECELWGGIVKELYRLVAPLVDVSAQKYIVGFTELQADAYSALKCRISNIDMATIRCEVMNPMYCFWKKLYKENLDSVQREIRRYGNVSLLDDIISFTKNQK